MSCIIENVHSRRMTIGLTRNDMCGKSTLVPSLGQMFMCGGGMFYNRTFVHVACRIHRLEIMKVNTRWHHNHTHSKDASDHSIKQATACEYRQAFKTPRSRKPIYLVLLCTFPEEMLQGTTHRQAKNVQWWLLYPDSLAGLAVISLPRSSPPL